MLGSLFAFCEQTLLRPTKRRLMEMALPLVGVQKIEKPSHSHFMHSNQVVGTRTRK